MVTVTSQFALRIIFESRFRRKKSTEMFSRPCCFLRARRSLERSLVLSSMVGGSMCTCILLIGRVYHAPLTELLSPGSPHAALHAVLPASLMYPAKTPQGPALLRRSEQRTGRPDDIPWHDLLQKSYCNRVSITPNLHPLTDFLTSITLILVSITHFPRF